MKKTLCIILVTFLPFKLTGQQIKVSVFNNIPVKGLIIALYEGDYNIYSGDQKITGFDEEKIFYITLYNKRLLLNNASGSIGSFDELILKSDSEDGRLQISIVDPKTDSRTYTGDIHLRIEYGRILIIDETDLEKYIAGVVEAETGTRNLPEFQKAQALLCRTYTYSHFNRHETEGFNLCDDVHCQAYHGSSPFTNSIYQSTVTTRNKVILAPDNHYITASFHANCGGETESSLNTWLKGEEYLLPVIDPYCKESKNYSWEKEIPFTEWKKYLLKYGINIHKSLSAFEMKKTDRQLYYRVGNDSILTRQIRNDWSLKSSFFQVVIKGSHVILKGHGYGHGVGMCQDGAMNMALQNFTSKEIINFYFKGVKIQDINEPNTNALL